VSIPCFRTQLTLNLLATRELKTCAVFEGYILSIILFARTDLFVCLFVPACPGKAVSHRYADGHGSDFFKAAVETCGHFSCRIIQKLTRRTFVFLTGFRSLYVEMPVSYLCYCAAKVNTNGFRHR
jgi:hypothetical protein